MSTLAIIVVLMLAFALTIFLDDLLLGRSRRQRAVNDERVELVQDAFAPNRPDFDAPFRRSSDPGE
jgi:hypothetical protein